jgi:L-ascorbate metabolism protein UlaG (beta-lactamase superfamily)
VKVTFIGHASLLIETHGLRILSDPWWRGPCFGAQWWNYPPPQTDAVYERPIDYIYISHGHHDHYHPGTLKTLNRNAKVLVSSELNIAKSIRELGFEVIEVEPTAPVDLGSGVKAWIWKTDGEDTVGVIDDGVEVCVNINDALHSAPHAVQDAHLQLLHQRFPKIDYAFCGYGTASHFPNCYTIPGKDDRATATKRQSYFNGEWCRIMRDLRPAFGFPFAASVVFFEEDLFELNEPVHNGERPTERYQRDFGKPSGELIDIAPGFVIENRIIVNDSRHKVFAKADLSAANPDGLSRANSYSAPTRESVDSIVRAISRNISLAERYLREIKGNYTFVIEFRGSDSGIEITKRGDTIVANPIYDGIRARTNFDVRLKTRAVYLRRSLEEDYGHEILFVGSGVVFEYKTKEQADRNLHRELAVLLRRHHNAPSSRYGRSAPWLYRTKEAIKAMIGRRTPDLYDLKTWVVYR